MAKAISNPEVGTEMYRMMESLYPICRSITGDGVRRTLDIIRGLIDLDVREIPSGTRVYDWIIPKEWNVKDAYVKNSKGEKVIDFQRNNLHLVSYSIPVKRRMPLAELKRHLFTLPERVDWIPYLTTYYEETWGFCLSHRAYEALEEDEYEVFIDTTLEQGSLTLGEYAIHGESDDEVLISSYICHPSLCNDNLSGVVLATFLARLLSQVPRTRYSYRFLFVPETIGSIVWLSLNEERVPRIKHGLVVTCVGDAGIFTYKRSRRGNAEIDRVAEHVLKASKAEHKVVDFFPWGSDERQFCSPGFNLPVGSLMRSPYRTFSEYHTSADNLGFVRPEYLQDSLTMYRSLIDILEHNRTYLNTNSKCEPQLGKRGLYPMIGAQRAADETKQAFLWVLNLSDGRYSLLDIAAKSGLEFGLIKYASDALRRQKLLVEVPNPEEQGRRPTATLA